MAIVVECSCGKSLKAKDDAAGRTARCPSCGSPVTVPTLRVTDAGIDLTRGNPFEDIVGPKKSKPQAAIPQLDPDSGDDPFTQPDWRKPQAYRAAVRPAQSRPTVPTLILKQHVSQTWKRRRIPLALSGLGLALLATGYFAVTWENPEFQGKSFSQWRKQLADVDDRTRAEAINAMGSIGKAGHHRLIVPVLLNQTQTDANSLNRHLSAKTLAAMWNPTTNTSDKNDADYIVGVLTGALEDTNDAVNAKYYLESMSKCMAVGQNVTNSRRATAFSAVLNYLSKNTQSGKGETVSVLDYFVMSGDDAQSKRAVEELGKLIDREMAANEMTLYLYSMLAISTGTHRGLPSERTSVDFSPIVPYLVAFVKKDIPYYSVNHRVCQVKAIEVLVQLASPADSVPALVYVVEKEHASSREALDALGQMKGAAKEAIPVLEMYKRKTSSPDSPNESVQNIINKIRGS